MATANQQLESFLELVNRYPSPHNGQPIKLKMIGDRDFELYFQRERGLQATEVSYIFSFVSMGVFVKHMEFSAHALGHNFSYSLTLPSEKDLPGQGLIQFAKGSLTWNTGQKDATIHEALLFRQTSRQKYTAPPHADLIHALSSPLDNGMEISWLTEQKSQQAIWLNQKAVFDDMFDEPVRQELNHWLRYSQKEKEIKRDGLSYDCMQINGTALHYVVNHPYILRLPIIKQLLKYYYLRTMKDQSRVCYALAPFKTEMDSFNVGLNIMNIWERVSEARQYLHPFGTIMTNQEAHSDFLKLAGITNESRAAHYLVFIFRVGTSTKPVQSLRIPYHLNLIIE
ncbi:MAG: hypothetical protein KBB55_01615 [Candidatus Buchananbacteria bacterium]|nr:hypothetical protein [Candidatus Buchananbacteria bacterium]